MADIVVSEFMDEDAVTDLARDFEVEYDPALAERPNELVAIATSARGLIVRNRTQVRGPLLASCDKLQVVGRLGVGLDNIDLEGCQERGIQVFPAVGANDLAVKEYIIAALLTLCRGSFFATNDVKAGNWPREQLIHREISGRRLGLVGFGNIAREVARAAQGLGMIVAACDPFIGSADHVWKETGVACETLEHLLSTSDAVSLHVPLSAQTRHLMNSKTLALMSRDSYLINSSRGGVVDEEALATALRNGELAGAVLDVFEQEPLPGGSVFVDVPNIILTPHIAGVTEESNCRVSAVTADNVRRVLQERGQELPEPSHE